MLKAADHAAAVSKLRVTEQQLTPFLPFYHVWNEGLCYFSRLCSLKVSDGPCATEGHLYPRKLIILMTRCRRHFLIWPHLRIWAAVQYSRVPTEQKVPIGDPYLAQGSALTHGCSQKNIPNQFPSSFYVTLPLRPQNHSIILLSPAYTQRRKQDERKQLWL